MFTLATFYKSKEWEAFRKQVIAERTKEDGFIYDEITGKPIVRRYDIILHHVEYLTEENVNDYNISLNPANIQIVSFKTHNAIHDRFGRNRREVFLVYGAPLSGKSTWISQNKSEGDLVVDMDSIWQCISGEPRYSKPNRLKAVAFKVRDAEIEAVKYRLGKWNQAYICGGYPMQSERERLIQELGAREVFIDTDKAECLRRLERLPETDGRDKEEWRGYIESWFERFSG